MPMLLGLIPGLPHFAIVAAIVALFLAAAVVVAIAIRRGRRTGNDGPAPATMPALSRLAVIAFVVGILGIFPNLVVLPVLAIVLACLAGRRIRRSQGRLRGSTAVVASLIMGCIGLVISAVLIALTFAQQRTARHAEYLSARQVVERARGTINDFVRQRRTLPDEDQATQLLKDRLDPWGNAIVFERFGEEYRLVSFGPDCEEGTEDDVVSWVPLRNAEANDK